jgi:hypothetical protein
MLSPLASLGTATLCFYSPATLACVLLCFKLRKTSVPATWFLLLLVYLSKFTTLNEEALSWKLTMGFEFASPAAFYVSCCLTGMQGLMRRLSPY